MSYETWLIGLLSAVIGAFAGHYFTVRLFRERVTNRVCPARVAAVALLRAFLLTLYRLNSIFARAGRR